MSKKFYFTAVMLGMGMFLFSGCGNTDSTDVSANNTETANQAKEAKESGEGVFGYDVNDYVTLGEYKNLSVLYPVPEITDEDLEMEAEYLVEDNAQYNEVTDRAVQDGDYISMDFVGTIDGEEFEGGSDEDYEFTLGEEEFPDDFEKNLIGKMPGENFTFKMTFSEDYDEELGGKEAEFNVTINSISEVVVPEYNDEFIKEVTDYDTVAAYEEALREELMAEAIAEAEETAGDDALLMAIENAEINGYPESLYESCYNSRRQEYQEFADMFGMELEEFIGDEEEFEEEVIDWVNEILVSQAIAKQEGFEDLDGDFGEDAEDLADEFGYDSLDEFVADYGETYVRVNLLRAKAVAYLFENANIQEVSEDEYYGGDDDESLEDFEEISETEI